MLNKFLNDFERGDIEKIIILVAFMSFLFGILVAFGLDRSYLKVKDEIPEPLFKYGETCGDMNRSVVGYIINNQFENETTIFVYCADLIPDCSNVCDVGGIV